MFAGLTCYPCAPQTRYADELAAWLAAGNKLPEKKKRAAPKKGKGKKSKKEESDGEEEAAGSGDDVSCCLVHFVSAHMMSSACRTSKLLHRVVYSIVCDEV